MQLTPDKNVDDRLWYYKGYEDFKSRINYGISEREYLEKKKDIFGLLAVSSVLSIGPGRIGYLFNRNSRYKEGNIIFFSFLSYVAMPVV